MKYELTKLGIQKYVAEYLYNFIKENNIKTIVETGVHLGTSSALFLSALPHEGKLISVEPNIKSDSSCFVADVTDDRWEIVKGFSEDVLEGILKSNKDNIDLFWHDSLHKYQTMMFEYKIALQYGARFVGSHDTSHDSFRITKKNPWDDFVSMHGVKQIIRKQHFGIAENKGEF